MTRRCGTVSVTAGERPASSSTFFEVGWAMKVVPSGKAALPPVWSPWSEQMTTYLIGCVVVFLIQSTISFVCATFPCPSATRTPSLLMTMRLTVVIWPPGSPARSASYEYTPGANCFVRGKSVALRPRFATSPVCCTWAESVPLAMATHNNSPVNSERVGISKLERVATASPSRARGARPFPSVSATLP